MDKYTPFLLPSCLTVMVSCVLLETVRAETVEPVTAADEAYSFDPNLFKGSRLSQAMLERFNKADRIDAGTYKVDVYVNNNFIERRSIRFVEAQDKAQGVVACLTPDLLENAGIIGDPDYQQRKKGLQGSECLLLAQVAQGSSSYFDFSVLRLNLTVPQSLMKNLPRGYVSPSELSAGSSIGFINYMGNYYYSDSQIGRGYTTESAFLSLNGGINLGKWQYRQQSNISMDNEHHTEWDHLRSYVQRPIDQLQSQLMLGQLYTSGRFFSGLQYKGINLSTDERMRPDSLRGYAPVIRGTAQSNAKVSVQQNGREIYQITVSPGPFEITDLYPTNYEGNLTVVITEADGSRHSLEIPYAAIPTSLRQGMTNYSFSAGRTDQDYTKNAAFADLTYEYGVNNFITLNSALRFADGYQAAGLGGVYGSVLGAVGANLTYSRAKVPTQDNNDRLDGWMANLNYSKTFDPTSTVISIAGYRYSTAGFRELNDVLGTRQAWDENNNWTSYSYLQRSRVQLSISQPLGRYGSFYLTGSTQDYRDGRDRDTSFQAGYNKSFGIVNMSLNYTRQRTHNLIGGVDKEERFDNFGGISINMPLGRNRNTLTPTLNANYNRSNQSDNYQVGVSGAFDEDYSLSYNVGVSGSTLGDQQEIYDAGLFKRFSNMQVGLNTSYGEHYWQAAANASGAIAIHSGGITLGPYLSDTFALVEAKGANGAKIISSPYSKIDRFGYALIPSITPYHYNSIAIDPVGAASNVELDGGEQRVAPYAGSTVKLKFKTRIGYSVLIQSHLPDSQIIPMGADVLNEQGEVIGMVGQAGQVYVKVEHQQGVLLLRWGDEAGQSCQLPYVLENDQLTQPLIKLQAVCKVEH